MLIEPCSNKFLLKIDQMTTEIPLSDVSFGNLLLIYYSKTCLKETSLMRKYSKSCLK
jgi:hypothetical protein